MPLVRWTRRVGPLLGLAVLLAGCATEGPRSALYPIGPVARVQMELFEWTFWLSIVVLVLVLGVMAFAIIRFRHRPSDLDAIPNQVHGSVPLEITWTLIPVVIVVLVAVPTVRAIFETEQYVEPTEEDILVNVTGFQWWWRFEYPELGIVTANELHIPVGRRVILNLDSADVLHSFWAPKLAGKRDLIPNQDNQLWFIADEPGLVYGHCAELCLGAHAYMRFLVIAESEEEFAAWAERFQRVQAPELAEAAPTEQLVQADPLIERGRALFAQKGCAGCHAIAGYAEYPVGNPSYPNLTNYGLRNTIAAAVMPNTPENLAAWLRDPQAIKPGNYMPTLWSHDSPEAEEEVAALVAFLESLGTEPLEPQAQANLHGGQNGNR